MKYEYRIDEEDFKRVDNKGKPLEINISEARQIESLLNLGYSVTKIYEKVDFEKNVSITNLRTFIRNLKEGNIDLEGDYPAPVKMVKDMDIEARLTQIEDGLKELAEKVDNMKATTETEAQNIKVSWRKRLGI